MTSLMVSAPTAFVLAAALSAGLNAVALLHWRGTEGAHWTARARVLFPVRKAAQGNIALIPLALVGWMAVFLKSGTIELASVGAVALAGAVLGTYPLSRAIVPALRFRVWVPQAAMMAVLALMTIGIFVGCMIAVPQAPHWSMPLYALPPVGLIVLFAYGLTLRIGRLVGYILPADDRLRAIVEAAAQRAGVPVPRIWISRGPLATAYAFPPTRELLFSEGLLDLLGDEEIAAICAHELQHLKEPKSAVIRRIAGSCTLVPLVFIAPLTHSLGAAGILVAALAALLIANLGRRFARRMEVLADQAGHATQAAEGVYARALEKLYEANAMPAVMRGRNLTHPHLYDRLVAAGVTPAYPRPAPPGGIGLQTILLGAIVLVALMVRMVVRSVFAV